MQDAFGSSKINIAGSMGIDQPAAEWNVDMLTRAMKRLDEKAYREFFARYYQRLWSYLFTVAKGDDRFVEDALQAAFSRIVKHVRIFDTEREFWNWLKLVARNALYDNYRKESALSRALRKMGLIEDGEKAWNEHEERNKEEELVWLDEAIAQLSSDEQSLIRFKYFEKLTYSQIADRLQTGPKAIESKLGRIRAKLKSRTRKGFSHE